MSKEVNVVDSAQLAKAESRKLFDNDEAMYIPETEPDISEYVKKKGDDFYVFVVPREKSL